MSDKYISGFFAGILGGISMNIWDFISYYLLHFSQLRYIDWTSTVLYNQKPTDFLSTIIALGSQIGFCGFLGILLVYTSFIINDKYLIIKGLIYGHTIWFLIYAIVILSSQINLYHNHIYTIISELIGSSIYGIVLAKNYNFLFISKN